MRHEDLSAPRRYSIAVDIGGTFTDCVVVGGAERIVAKSHTVPQDPSLGVLNAMHVAAVELGLDLPTLLSSTASFVHSSTIATNTMIQRNGPHTGLLTTRGHEDSLIIGRVSQKVAGLSEREKTHIVHLHKAEPPLVAWADIRGIDERIDSRGRVVVAMNDEQVAKAADELVARGVESLAICFLWSFVNDAHERRAKEIVRARHPNLYLSISAEVSPLVGEYERCVSTVLNSYIGPPVTGYLQRLEERLRALGYDQSLLVMQSNGGLTTVRGASETPLLTLDSGPSAGILGSRYFGALHGERNLICTDVGGTSFDVGLVFAGELQLDSAPVIDQYAYSVPKVLVRSIGAGGGSIAWIDRAGGLRVGPRSAGAEPGPACYGRGGTEPTVTDADVVLGYLNPDTFLGGRYKLDVGAAHAAIRRLAELLGVDAIEAASGIFEIANAQMADLIRKSTVERGFDPRDFAILAYGGAGPVHAAFYAADTGAHAIYVPADSSVFSAFGILTADYLLTAEKTLQMRTPLTSLQTDATNELLEALERRVLDQYRQNNVDVTRISLARSVDVRFALQAHALNVPVPAGRFTAESLPPITDRFVAKYELTYGRDSAYRGAGFELLNFRVSGTVPTGLPQLDGGSPQTANRPRPDRTRSAYFATLKRFTEAACFRGTALRSGDVVSGPALVERMGDTIVIPPGFSGAMDLHGAMVLRADA